MLEKIDLFGKGISLNFKGREAYTTKVGGLLSLLLIVYMVSYGCFTFKGLIDRSNHQDSYNEVFHNITSFGELTGS